MPRLLLSICFLLCAIFAHAQTSAEALREQLAALPHGEKRLHTLVALVELEASNQPVPAIAHAREAISLAREFSDSKRLADAHLYLGLAMRNRTEYDSAIAYYDKALLLYTALGNDVGQAQTLIYKGVVLKNSSRHDEALQQYQQAIVLAGQAKDTSLLASATLKQSAIHRQQGNNELRLHYIMEAMGLARQVNDSLIYAKAIYNLGIYKFETTNSADSAISYFERALPYTNATRHGVFYLSILNNLAALYTMQGSDAKAEALFESNLRALDSLGVRALKLELLVNMGELYISTERPEKVVGRLDEIVALSKERNSHIWTAQAYGLSMKALQALGRYEEALEYAALHKAYNDSMVSQTSVETINELEQRFQSEQKQAALDLAAAESAQKTAQLRGAMAIGGLLLMLAAILVWFYRRQQRTTAQLANQQRQIDHQRINQLLQTKELDSINAMIEGEEKERLRIARDLHDRLGSMLSTVKLFYSGMDLHEEPLGDQKLKQFDRATNLLDDVCQEVRNIAHNMATGILGRFGLDAALRDMGETIVATGQLQVRVLTYGLEKRMDKTLEITSYRVIQEMVNNVLKHAKATELIIQLNRHEDSVSITVEDNGVGFDPKEKDLSSGMGLGNIRDRVEKLGGTLEIDSQPGVGTTMLADIPVAVAEAHN